MEQTITQLREELINYFCHLLPKNVSITYDEKEIDKIIQEHFVSIPVEKPVKPESNGQIKYAIKHKDKFMLMQVSNSEKQLEEKIEQAYLLAHSIQPKGSNYTREDFMQDIEKVKVTFEKIG